MLGLDRALTLANRITLGCTRLLRGCGGPSTLARATASSDKRPCSYDQLIPRVLPEEWCEFRIEDSLCDVECVRWESGFVDGTSFKVGLNLCMND